MGKCVNTNFTKPDITAVTNITEVPQSGVAQTDLTLSCAIEPDGASYKDVVWSVTGAGETGATISNGNVLKTQNAGTVTITATIENGKDWRQSYTQDFTITIGQYTVIPVTSITDVPETLDAGGTVLLSGTVNPETARHKVIMWTIADDGGTGAAIDENNWLTTQNV